MIALTLVPCGPSGTRRVRISLPLVPGLIDNVRYWLPDDLPPPEGEELRPMSRPRITKAPRAPSLRTLVKWAQKCDSAEQLGERLRRRYQRQQQHQGMVRLAAPPALGLLCCGDFTGPS